MTKRVLAVLWVLVFAASVPAAAATIANLEADALAEALADNLDAPAFDTVLSGIYGSYYHPFFETTLNKDRLILQTLILAVLLLTTHRLAYSAAVASAISRIRWIMARRPLERCADRWSFTPKRPNSAAASTFSTSRTGKPS